MSEMLGNRYFIARQYEKALANLEEALLTSNTPDKVKKKLIICYVETGNVERALFHFHDLIRKDPKIIVDTDHYHDDCPCPEIIPNWENKQNNIEAPRGYFESLGMLYLYCDKDISIQYFEKSLPQTKFKTVISSIIEILTKDVAVNS